MREFEYWTPEPLFADQTVFCLASGPSLTREVCETIRGQPSIVVNSSCMLAPFATVLYFTDSSWYEERRDLVANWPGLVVCMSRSAKRELPDKVKRVRGEGDPAFHVTSFPPPGSDFIRQGRSSGHTAISLAIAMGAKRVVMLGYDMRAVDGREHCHAEYSGERDLKQYASDFVPAFTGWRDAALKSGVEILNATPESAVQEFPFVSLDGPSFALRQGNI